MMTLQHRILTALILLVGAVTPSVVAQDADVSPRAASAPAPQAAAPSSGCHDEQGLTYLCGLSVPEDILNVGDSGLLLVSGHRAPGHLYLVDPATRTQSELIHGPTFRLLRQDSYHNSVARLADGGFVTTRMRDQNFRGGGGAPVGITGHLVEWHPGGQPQPLPDTELSLPNGIDVSKDGRYIYVAAIGSQELVRFDRRATPMARRTVSLPIRPDNVHWATNGTLLTAGPNYVPPAVCSGAGCATGWSVLQVDPETLAFSRLGGADHAAAMQRVSSAMRVGDDIWVGSNDDRIARFSLRRP
jgi:hypothetical protein